MLGPAPRSDDQSREHKEECDFFVVGVLARSVARQYGTGGRLRGRSVSQPSMQRRDFAALRIRRTDFSASASLVFRRESYCPA